jgi:hypothetical protein
MIADRIRLPLTFDAAALAADLASIGDDEWMPHFNTGIYEGDWSGVSLRSVGGRADTIYPDPAATEPFADTAMLRRCPALGAVLDRLNCELLAVRLLRLGPGAAIGEHRDHCLGYEDGEVRLHLPLTTNEAVSFVLAGERVDMQPGELWYLNFNEVHAVANRGTEPRIHLVIDCVVNRWLSAQLGAD